MKDRNGEEFQPYEPEYPEPFPMKPLRNQLVVYELDISKSKILLPDTAKARLGIRYGRVVAVGPGTVSPFTGEFLQTELKKGACVAFGEYGGNVFHHAGEPYKLLQMADVVMEVDLDSFDPFTTLKDPDKMALPGLSAKSGTRIVRP